MSLDRIFFILLSCLCSVLPHTAQAELQLEKWKTYGQMAEQSAICASFTTLMEAQSVLNPDLGALWQERRKFTGAVIRKAVFLELGRDSTEIEIDKLIESYRDWVLSSLMGTDDNIGNNGNDVEKKTNTSRQKFKTLMNRQCKSLFKQGDELIRKQRPDLVYLLKNISKAKAISNNSQLDKNSSKKTANTKVKPPTSSSDKAVQLSIGGNSSFILTLPSQKPVPSDKQPSQHASEHVGMKKISKSEPIQPKLVQISGPLSRPNQMQIKTNISTNRLSKLLEKQAEASVNLQIPRGSADTQKEEIAGDYFAQLGAFAQLDNAKAEKQRLENKFSALFAKLPLHIAEITDSGPSFYRIQTIKLSQKHIKTLCELLWPHKIACIAKPQNMQ